MIGSYRGHTCPSCGSESGVYDSRPRHGTVQRRRRCNQCGERWNTLEVDVAEIEKLERSIKQLLRLRKILNDLVVEEPAA